VLHGVDLEVRRGDRLVILGPNGIGKSTLLKIVVGELEADAGEVEWGYETHPGYFAQDHREQLEEERTAPPRSGSGTSAPARTGASSAASSGSCSSPARRGEAAERPVRRRGGPAGVQPAGLEQPNVLVLDEPTNHLDLESIEALVAGLQAYDGTLILVSHDRWFVASWPPGWWRSAPTGSATTPAPTRSTSTPAATTTWTWTAGRPQGRPDGKQGKKGGRRSLRSRNARTRATRAAPEPRGAEAPGARRDELTDRIDAAETRIAEIDAAFCEPGYYDRTPAEVATLEAERAELEATVERLMSEWESVERQLDQHRSVPCDEARPLSRPAPVILVGSL
jgi:hypothetical protein